MTKYTFYTYYHELKVSVSQKYCVFYVCVSKNRMAFFIFINERLVV